MKKLEGVLNEVAEIIDVIGALADITGSLERELGRKGCEEECRIIFLVHRNLKHLRDDFQELGDNIDAYIIKQKKKQKEHQ